MIVDLKGWLRGVWPTRGEDIVSEYASISTHKHFLADLAQRGQVFGACHVPNDPYTSAVNEGRRQMALEIIKLAGEEPERLFALIERPAIKREK